MNATFHIDLHPEVESDYGEAYHWYELQQEGLGERFLLSVRNKLTHIQTSPETYSVNPGKNTGRRGLMISPMLLSIKFIPGRNGYSSVLFTMKK